MLFFFSCDIYIYISIVYEVVIIKFYYKIDSKLYYIYMYLIINFFAIIKIANPY